MKKIILSFITALIMSVVGLQAQSWTTGTNLLYSNPETTKVGIGITNPTELLQINGGALKIGNSTSADDRALNMIKIGDGNYVQIGEWEADDMLSFKASKYNFTGGKVGIGMATPMHPLDVNGYASMSKILLKDSHFVFGHSSGAGVINFGANGKLYFRNNLVNGNISNYTDLMVLAANGNLGIGTTEPQATLDVNGDVLIPYEKSYWIGVSEDEGRRLRMHFNNDDLVGAYIDYQPSLQFRSGINDVMLLDSLGSVGIGTKSPQYKLDVNGTVRAREIVVNLHDGADFVFEDNYNLKPLDEVHEFIKANKRLPEIPSAAEMQQNVTDLGALQVKLLQKIEELTLYMIDLKKENDILKQKVEALTNR